jgi:HEAT repeat protein
MCQFWYIFSVLHAPQESAMRLTRTAITLIIVVLNAMSASTAVRAVDLETLFRAEIELAAPKLGLKTRDLDPKLALALAASGVSWQPSSDGVALLRQQGKHWVYTGWSGRWQGLRAATASGDRRTEFAFALSLVLDPAPDREKWMHAYAAVSQYGTGLDSALMGIVGAPSNLPLLPSLPYAAADALVWRYDTRHTQFWLSLADSRDAYLRSRAIAALGLIACTDTRSPIEQLLIPLRQSAISAAQRLMFEDLFLRAAGDRSYRVRAAAALALGLLGSDAARERLIRLARDPAYVVLSGRAGGTRRIAFPVRDVAGSALRRYGVVVRPSGGELDDREVRRATRGCRDVTKDTGGMMRGVTSGVRFYDGYW